MKKSLMIMCTLVLVVSAQAQEPTQAQQVKYTVKGVSKENGKMVYLEESWGLVFDSRPAGIKNLSP